MRAIFSYVKSCHRKEGLDNFVQTQRADPRLVGEVVGKQI